VLGYIRGRSEAGAELVTGGAAALADSGGYYVEPTLFSATSDELRVVREEIFGPVLVASPYATIEEAVEPPTRASSGSRRASGTRDVSTAHRVAAQLRAGTVYVNRWGMSDPSVPFGGVKASGVRARARTRGARGWYLETKTVWTAL